MFRRTRKCIHTISTYDKAMELNNKLNLQGCDCLPNYYDWLFTAKEKKKTRLLNRFHMQHCNEEAIFWDFHKLKKNKQFSKH